MSETNVAKVRYIVLFIDRVQLSRALTLIDKTGQIIFIFLVQKKCHLPPPLVRNVTQLAEFLVRAHSSADLMAAQVLFVLVNVFMKIGKHSRSCF